MISMSWLAISVLIALAGAGCLAVSASQCLPPALHRMRGRAPNPVWDNPGSQLPGTGLGAGFKSGLYGTSRRRDHSVPERTRLRTSQSEGVSTGSTADGSAALPSPGVDRPSLFSSFPVNFAPFSAVNRHSTKTQIKHHISSQMMVFQTLWLRNK